MDTLRALSKRVLVVDDDPLFQKLVESVLAGCGLECVVVRSGEEALRLTESQKPLAVVLDGLLPGLRGDEVARRLRTRYAKPELPILFASAFYRDLRTRNQLLTSVQVDVVLHKPLGLEELKRALLRIPVVAEASQAALEAFQNPVAPADTSNPEAHEGYALALDELDDPELLSEFLALSQERAAGMQGALSALGDQSTSLDKLRVDAHRFRGSGSSYGLPELSRLGGLIEDLLGSKPYDALTMQERARLVGLVEALADKVAQAAGKRALLRREGAAGPRSILLLDSPGPLAASCVGIEGIRVAHDADAAISMASQVLPDVAFVVADRPAFDSLSAVRRLAHAGVRSILVMGGPDSMESRLASLKAGACGYLFRLPDAEALRRMAEEFHQPLVEARVLAVDSDVGSLGRIAELLAPLGLAVEPCPERDKMLPAVERLRPNLVIVVAHPSDSGVLDGLRAFRADPSARHIPVIVLSPSREPAARLAALEAGADDFLTVPYPRGELGARALGHVRRAFKRELELPRDLATGALRQSALCELLDRTLALARRAGRAVTVVEITTDLLAIRRTHGSNVAEALAASLVTQLRAAFRATDAVARLDETRFALMLEDVGSVQARALLERKLPFVRVTDASLGIALSIEAAFAAFPEVGGDGRALLQAASRRS